MRELIPLAIFSSVTVLSVVVARALYRDSLILLSGEEMLWRARLHWSVLLGSATVIIVLLGIALLSLLLKTSFVALPIYFLVWGMVIAITNSYLHTHLTLTNRRVILQRKKVTQKYSVEFYYHQIESVAVHHDFFDQLLGSGTVSIMGSGGSAIHFHYATDAEYMRTLINAGMQAPRRVNLETQTVAGFDILQDITYSGFEKYVGTLFEKNQFAVEHCGGKNDGGVDLKVYKNGKKGVVQCKHYSNNRTVGPETVRDLRGAMVREDAIAGFLVTTARFTFAAHEEAATVTMPRIVLIDGARLARWAETGKM